MWSDSECSLKNMCWHSQAELLCPGHWYGKSGQQPCTLSLRPEQSIRQGPSRSSSLSLFNLHLLITSKHLSKKPACFKWNMLHRNMLLGNFLILSCLPLNVGFGVIFKSSCSGKLKVSWVYINSQPISIERYIERNSFEFQAACRVTVKLCSARSLC